ncbi:MAG TPA: hypothetical protein VI670_26035 [Thermoanaerobaculia bacterium]|jgi:hypothetical protein
MFRRFNQSELEERAREDARLGIYEPDAYITANIGPEPSFDPVGNLRHANVGARLQNPMIEETEADMRREEDEMARHPSAHLLLAFLMVLLFMECAGSIYLMRTVGVESPERVIFGTALAVCIFFMTWLCSRARNRAISLAAIAALGLLVAALTVIRVDENTGGGSSAVGWATALVMMAVTIGPAVMAEHVLRLMAPVLPIVRHRYRLRRRARHARFGQRSATWFVNRLASRRDEWQQTAARIRASYDIAHRAARAALGESPFATSTTNAVVPYRGTSDPSRKES